MTPCFIHQHGRRCPRESFARKSRRRRHRPHHRTSPAAQPAQPYQTIIISKRALAHWIDLKKDQPFDLGALHTFSQPICGRTIGLSDCLRLFRLDKPCCSGLRYGTVSTQYLCLSSSSLHTSTATSPHLNYPLRYFLGPCLVKLQVDVACILRSRCASTSLWIACFYQTTPFHPTWAPCHTHTHTGGGQQD